MSNHSSLPRLTRQSITLRRSLRKKLDARVKPAHDAVEVHATGLRRREFIALLGGAAAIPLALPLAARAQQGERMRRIGIFMDLAADHPQGQARVARFLQSLLELGWADGRNVQILTRWGAGDTERHRNYAAELVAFAPDVILASGSPTVVALQRATRTVPIVFTTVADPVGGGFVASLARPGGNVTGFTTIEYGMSGKWLELLKEIAPHVKRVAVLRDPTLASGAGQLGALQAVAPSFGVELLPLSVRDASNIERGLQDFARVANGGLIVTGSPSTGLHRELIIALAAKHRLPAVYPFPHFASRGGLISYGPDLVDPYRLAAGYVDRIIKGEKPAELPVQAPTKYELTINLKTAKALGLTVPPALLARADEVIE